MRNKVFIPQVDLKVRSVTDPTTVSSQRYPVMKTKKTKIKETGMTVDLSKEYEKSELIQILSNRDRTANSRYGSL